MTNRDNYFPDFRNDREAIAWLCNEVLALKDSIQSIKSQNLSDFLDTELLDKVTSQILKNMKAEIRKEMEAFVEYSEKTKVQVSEASDTLTSKANQIIADADGILKGMASRYELP